MMNNRNIAENAAGNPIPEWPGFPKEPIVWPGREI